MRKRDRQQTKELMIVFALKTILLTAVMLAMFWSVGYFVAAAAPVMENALNGAYEAMWGVMDAILG